MRIAVVHNLPAGGAMRVLFEQVSRLAKKHRVDVFTLSTSDNTFLPLRNIVHQETIIKFHYPQHFPFTLISIIFKLSKAYLEIARLINKANYDVAYVFPCFLTQAPLILKYLKIPSVYFCPEPKREFYENIPRAGKKLTYYLTLPFRNFIKNIDYQNTHFANKILTLSKFNQQRIKKIYDLESKIIPLGVNTKNFYPLNLKKKKMVLSVGNFTLLKGHDFTIRSISYINEVERPELVIVGIGGNDKQYLMELAKALKVKLSCYNNPNDIELNRLYNQASLFGFPPLNEPFGLVALEASASGTRILAVAEGGVPEVISDKIMGHLLPRDEHLFSEAILKQLKTEDSEKQIKSRIAYVKLTYNWDKSVAILEREFNSVNNNN